LEDKTVLLVDPVLNAELTSLALPGLPGVTESVGVSVEMLLKEAHVHVSVFARVELGKLHGASVVIVYLDEGLLSGRPAHHVTLMTRVT
jgi:hypothetical protein